MDPGVELPHSLRLVVLPPSTYPAPLGERIRKFGWNNSHFDSHTDLTMSHHELEISERPHSPPLVWEVEPSSTYGTLVGSDPSMVGTFRDDPS